MAESRKMKGGFVKKDRISELPRNLQEIILCFLPIRDAVRTSILSTKWRHSWTMIPHLSFDYTMFDYEDSDERWFSIVKPHGLQMNALKFVSAINKVLIRHNGPIVKFSMETPSECDALITHDYINQWIPLFARKGIKQLFLCDNELREVVSHQFASLDLTHLRLSSVWFSYTPVYGRFTCLKNLELINATFDFGPSIFHCPVLEKLTLVICQGIFHTNFLAPNLKFLLQICPQITSDFSSIGLENLTEFFFKLTMEPDTETETSNVVKFLSNLHKIEKLSAGFGFIKYLAAGGSPIRLPKPLSYLKTLSICDMDFTDSYEISCLLCLIRSAPNLCKLHILADCYPSGKEDLKNCWIEDSEKSCIDNLEIVTFSDFRGRIAELELVKFLLARSPSLKTMSIHRSERMKKDVALAMTDDMLEFPRSSSRAQIRRLIRPVSITDFNDELWADYDL